MLLLLLLAAVAVASADTRPHIVWVVCDDLGFDDTPITGTGALVKTPTLSKLASEGVVLQNYYVNAICTPTRASFMTGRYPYHLGLQQGVIRDGVRNAVPLNETMVAEFMKEAGYSTHIVGKWHLGFYEHKYTPQARGFDTHMGYYTGNEEYWNHTSPCWQCGNYTAVDLHRATFNKSEPILDRFGVYSTNMFTAEIEHIIETHNVSQPLFLYAPYEGVHGAASCRTANGGWDCSNPAGDLLQAPQHYIDQQSDIKNPNRRTFAGMVGAVDEGVANITKALAARGMLNSTLLLFTTDNGAPDYHFGGGVMSNWPLRGGKGQLWEGGVRGTGLVWGAGLEKTGYRNMGLMHATDWLPTFARVAGAQLPPSKIAALDGFDQWDTISKNASSPRTTIVHNIYGEQAAFHYGTWKYLQNVGNAGWGPNPHPHSQPDGAVFGGTLRNDGRSAPPNDNGPWLFNLADDPTETTNLAEKYPANLKQMQEMLRELQRSEVPCRYPDPDPTAQPKLIPGLNVCTEGLCLPMGVWEPWVTAPSSANCTFEKDMDFWPSTHDAVAAASAQDCCAACASDNGCGAATFVPEQGHCFLKPSNATRRPKPGALGCVPNK